MIDFAMRLLSIDIKAWGKKESDFGFPSKRTYLVECCAEATGPIEWEMPCFPKGFEEAVVNRVRMPSYHTRRFAVLCVSLKWIFVRIERQDVVCNHQK